MTVGMGYTGSADGIWDESDMHVLFDPDFLLTGQQAESKAIYYLLDQDADLFDTDVDGDGTVDLLANINANGLRFTVDGVEQVIEFDQALLTDGSIRNHDDFVAALQDSLDALIAAGAVPADTVLYVDDTLTDFTFLDDGSRSSDIPAIVLETQTSTILDSVGFAWVEDLVGEYNVYGRLDDEAAVADEPLSVQVDLEKVGRGADGGELLIGSMDKFNEGINEFYVTVFGDDSRPSSLSRLDSTGNDLDRIYITSDNDGFPEDTFADLTIGNANTVGNPHPFNGTPGPVNDGMSLIESDGFGGNLSLGTAANRVNDLAELDTTDMAGNTTFWAEIDAIDPVTGLPRNVQYDYKTGSGDDTIDLILDGDAVDAVGEGLSIATNAGDDVVTVDAPVGEASPFQLSVSQNTMQYLSNLAVATGAGEDTVEINDNFRFMVEAGADSDFVYINSQDNAFDAFDGETGAWVFSTATGVPTFGNRVLYQAELTVNFAGFESTVTVQTTAANNFVATQLDINAALMAAIDASPELSRMLAYAGGTGSQQLTITSLVDGANTLAVDLYQPQLVAAGVDPAAGEVNLAAADEDALLAGIVATDAAEDSNTDPLAYMNANDGSLNADGTVGTGGPLAAPAYDFQGAAIGGSFDAIGVRNVNFSVINMGSGANDLVVLDSNDNSANILVIDQTFGKVSVVNFFDDAARTVVGNHAIDFTAYLNNVDSNTGSTLSEDPIAITLNVTPITAAGSLAAANSVNMLRLAGTAAESFAALTAEDLITALNGDGTADDNYANITNATLDAAANTAALVGNVQDHIVMVENAANLGEYKVFYLTSTVDPDTNTTGGDFDTDGVLLGTLDFGASINFNLVGSATWNATYNALIDAADDIAAPDTIAPTLDDTDPADNANDVAVDTDIVLTFDEDVQAGTGNISVFNAGGLVEAVDVADADFDGATVTVDLTADLEPGTFYFVRVDATAIQDLAGNAFAGITSPLDFNFTTVDDAPAENTFDMAAGGTYAGTVGEVDVFQYEVDSSSGRAVGTDGEVEITGFTAGEDRIEFMDAGNQLTTANFDTFPGVSLAENPFADNTTIAFDPDEGVASLITIQGIQDGALDTIDYLVV
jgi:methionine-rich copper-binding protein CopC